MQQTEQQIRQQLTLWCQAVAAAMVQVNYKVAGYAARNAGSCGMVSGESCTSTFQCHLTSGLVKPFFHYSRNKEIPSMQYLCLVYSNEQ